MTFLAPPSGLLQTASDGSGAQTLHLVSDDWFRLQNHVAAVLHLPLDFAEYQQRYGDASSGGLMKDCYDAMHALRTVGSKYGNPTALRAKITADPKFLARSERPEDEAYAATVWTVQQGQQATFNLASHLRSIPNLAKDHSPGETVEGIRHLFLAKGQIVDSMHRTSQHADALIRQVEGLERDLETHQEAMRTYTERSSRTRTELDQELGELKAKIEDLESSRDAAYDEWLALTISAAAVPATIGIVGIGVMVLLAVPTGGKIFAVGSAVTGGLVAATSAALGTAAGVARGKYDGLVGDLATTEDLRRKRALYRHDLGALDQLMGFSLPASQGVVHRLRAFRDGWTSTADMLREKASHLTESNLAGSPWLNSQAMNDAAQGWTDVNQALRGFTTGSLVDTVSVTAGEALPADDPQWEASLKSRLAA